MVYEHFLSGGHLYGFSGYASGSIRVTEIRAEYDVSRFQGLDSLVSVKGGMWVYER